MQQAPGHPTATFTPLISRGGGPPVSTVANLFSSESTDSDAFSSELEDQTLLHEVEASGYPGSGNLLPKIQEAAEETTPPSGVESKENPVLKPADDGT